MGDHLPSGTIQIPSGVIQNHLKELYIVSETINRTGFGDFAAGFDLRRISDYLNSVKIVHNHISNGFAKKNAGWQDINQFIEQWNNVVAGVLYVEEFIHHNMALTNNQRDILLLSLRQIHEFAREYGASKY